MLELFAAVGMNAQMWESLSSRAALPCTSETYFLPNGSAAPHGECGRQYRRFQVREKGVIARDGRYHAIYIKDASRKGIGFLSPVQLFPGERVPLLLAEPGLIELEVRRCRRQRAKSYECGCVFASGLASVAVYKQLIQRVSV